MGVSSTSITAVVLNNGKQPSFLPRPAVQRHAGMAVDVVITLV
jgi:hypothetical protein